MQDRPPGIEPSTPTLNPGDEAAAGTPGTGEAMCPNCKGTGRIGEGSCENCGGTGLVVEAVGGG